MTDATTESNGRLVAAIRTEPIAEPGSNGSGATAASWLPPASVTRLPFPPVPDGIKQFLMAVFDPKDKVLIRPIETWTDGNRKRSHVIYDRIHHWPAASHLYPNVWAALLKMSEENRANLFYGVCPRFPGRGGLFDEAWQIRTVRVLWSDIDHCTPDEALKRCEAAGLPRPTIIVRSGHGVHLYWKLVEPYLIVDAGDPPPVKTEWVKADGKNVPRHLIEVDGERIYQFLDPNKRNKNSLWPTVSPQGQFIQYILSGIADPIGGDHTQDLARLLRLPDTLNRKDQRNGKPPVPCELVECDPSRGYPLADFGKFAEASPAAAKAKEVVKIRLPTGVKLTSGRLNKLSDFINACAVAPVTQRSEPDFRLCCRAIEQGIDKEEIWPQVESVGKFAERGRPYFDLTWEKAEERVRQTIYDRTCRKRGTGVVPRVSPPVVDAEDIGDGADQLHPPEPLPQPDRVAEDDDDVVMEEPDDPHRLARAWLENRGTHKDGRTIRYFREEFHRWKGIYWQAIPDAEVRAELAHFCKQQVNRNYLEMVTMAAKDTDPTVPKVTQALVNNVMQALGGETVLPGTVEPPVWLGDDLPERRNYIALANGLLDVDALLSGKGDVLLPHTPRWFSPVYLPYDFDAAASCPRWLAFLERNLGGDRDKARLLQQYAGYLLLTDASKQKFLMMAGEGANGKSVICAVFRAMLGERNVSSVPLEMFAEKFHLSGTLGKLANIVAEVGELDKIAEGQLKAFVTGDPILFEKKFKAAFTARPTARLVLATNNPPQFSDKSDGIWRRMLLLLFTVQIPPAEQVAGMDQAEFWEAAGELPGILNWALAGLHELRGHGRFVVPAACQEAVEKLRTDMNPARRFLREHYQAGDGEILTADLYAAYGEWCRQQGHHALAVPGFGKEVLRTFPGVEKHRKGPKGDRYWVYGGLVPQTD